MMKWPALDPGNLRSRVTIQRQAAASSDISGTAPGGWEDFLTSVDARIQPQNQAESIHNGQITSRLQVWVTIYYRPGITKSMRVVSANGTYLIEDIANPEEANNYLVLVCIAIGEND